MIKSMNLLIYFLIYSLMFTVNDALASYEKLNKRNYEKTKEKKAVIIYGINWGRKWGCSGADSAQLQNISFENIENNTEQINLSSPSKLRAEDVFKPYAVIVDPGEYFLSSFDIRIARAINQIEHIKWNDSELSSGGSFKVNAGEVVYIGDFGLDCINQPILWRYYVQKEDFNRFVNQFKGKYKFLADKEVIYRLFQTDQFGQ